MLSADGRWVAYSSTATNLTRRPDTNGSSDVFLRNNATGRTRLVSVSSAEGQGNEGSFSPAVRDLEAHRTEVVSVDEDGTPDSGHDTGSVALSATGRYVLFSSYDALTKDDADPPLVDWNGDDIPDGDADVFLRDRETGRIVLVSRLPGSDTPVQAKGMDMNSGARQVVLWSSAPLSEADTNNASDVWIRHVTEFTAG